MLTSNCDLSRFLWTVFTSESGESYTVLQLIYKIIDILNEHEGRIDQCEYDIVQLYRRLGIAEEDIKKIYEELKKVDISGLWDAVHQLQNELIGLNTAIEQLLQEVV